MASADWDFNLVTWSLNGSQYVSIPTALKLWEAGDSSRYVMALRNTPDCLAVDQGRLVTWLRTQNHIYGQPMLVFRAQVGDLTAWWRDSYSVLQYGDKAYLRFFTAGGVETNIGTWSFSFPVNTWKKIRLTWWNGKDGSGIPATVFRLEYWDGAAWVKGGADLYDTNERNKGSSVNRVGVCNYGALGSPVWFDDTEIWRAT